MVTVRMSLQSIDPNSWYRLSLRCIPNFCLDVINNGRAHEDGLLQIAPHGDYTGQYWQFVPSDDGAYTLRTWYTGAKMLLDVRDVKPMDPHLTEGPYTLGKFWSLLPGLDGTWRIFNQWSGPAFALGPKPDRSWPRGERLEMSEGDTERQQWTITKIREIGDEAPEYRYNVESPMLGWAKYWEPQLLIDRYLNVYTLEWSEIAPERRADPSALHSDLAFHAWSREGSLDTFKEFLDWDSRKLVVIDVTKGFEHPKILDRSSDFLPTSRDDDDDIDESMLDEIQSLTLSNDHPHSYISTSPLIAHSKTLPTGTGFLFVIADSTPLTRIGVLSTAAPNASHPRLWKAQLLADKATFNLDPLSVRQRGVEDAPPKNFVWCSKGTDTEFRDREAVPVRHLSILGHGGNAVVDRVTCVDRILARKQIRCTRRMPRTTALRELEAIRKVQSHHHVIKIVGSYTQGVTIGILLHPAAECDFQTALERISDEEAVFFTDRARYRWWRGRWFEFFGCLAHGLAFMHDKGIRHRDIKPRNILVTVDGPLYTDFGIARDFSESAQSTTTGPATKTHIYCAPEVAAGGERGRSSDVFSLGCVFLEMFTVLTDAGTIPDCTLRRTGEEDASYHANADKVEEWISQLIEKEVVSLATGKDDVAWGRMKMLLVIGTMLGHERYARPSAVDVWRVMRDLAVGMGPAVKHELGRMCGSCCFGSPVG